MFCSTHFENTLLTSTGLSTVIDSSLDTNPSILDGRWFDSCDCMEEETYWSVGCPDVVSVVYNDDSRYDRMHISMLEYVPWHTSRYTIADRGWSSHRDATILRITIAREFFR